jgi:parallel beta-helix repeat protein
MREASGAAREEEQIMLRHTSAIVLVGLAALGLAAGLGTTAVHADTIYVCWDGSGDYLTIQEGIDAAQDGDEVVVCDGAYTGPGNKDLDFHGKPITVRSENGPENCIIDCEASEDDLHRGFYFHNGETEASAVDGFTITNGYEGPCGGAVYCIHSSSPTISNCTITGNSVGYDGGGVCCSVGSSPTLDDCTINGNSAGIYGNGGGLSCYRSSPTLNNCTISGNSAERGGGVDCYESSPTLTNSTIRANSAVCAGGVWCYENSGPTLSNCTIAENLASGGLTGGAVSCSYNSSPTLSNCTISGNTANGGHDAGAVYCWQSSSPTLTNCAISDNSGVSAGAVYCAGNCNPTLSNCTISANSGDTGGGLCCYGSSPTLTNCILWGDTAQEIYLHSGSPVVTYCNVQGGWSGPGNIDADALFVDPDGPDDDPNTWEDNDFHLSAGSPCIDAGCNWGVPPDITDLDGDDDTSEYTPLDLDGEGRFFDDPDTGDTGCGCPPVVDMGAYEFGDAGPQPCPGDLDCDRVVGHSDLGILLSAWHWSDAGDLNCDGETGHADLAILLAHWGESCP